MCGIFALINSDKDYELIKKEFQKGKIRGPENTELLKLNNTYIGFHRLAINGLNDKSNQLSFFNWNTKKVYYRTCSSDMSLINEILLKPKSKREYYFPDEIKPKVIFDIGGNIGITSIYLASIFPSSKIYTFEPLKENFEILKKNTSQYTNIRVFNFGLGSEKGIFKVCQPIIKKKFQLLFLLLGFIHLILKMNYYLIIQL